MRNEINKYLMNSDRMNDNLIKTKHVTILIFTLINMKWLERVDKNKQIIYIYVIGSIFSKEYWKRNHNKDRKKIQIAYFNIEAIIFINHVFNVPRVVSNTQK